MTLRVTLSGLLSVILLAATFSLGEARAVEPEGIARAVSVQGTVEARRLGQEAWQPVKLHDGFFAGDTIRVGPKSRADLALLDRSFLRLDENTTVTIQPLTPERTGVLELLRGVVHFLSRGPKSLDVKTEFVAVGVRGTEFLVAVDPDAASVTVYEGAVLAENPQGSVTLAGGQSALARRGQAPVLQVAAYPRDAVRWALYYPPVLDLRDREVAGDPAAQEALRRSIEAYRRGDLRSAFDALAAIPPEAANNHVLTYRAQLLLAVGRASEARAELERTLTVFPGDPDALSLQAIVAVVQDEKPRALELARAAVAAAPRSPTPLIARSYAQQALFDLEGARKSVDEAVRLAPEDALAWARLAELRASFGDTSGSLEAAKKAAALAPDLSRTQTVLGFAHLRDIELAKAKKAFEKAIELDSADPLPRLGLGLTKIRGGDLDAGARELEIAASLGPNDAIIRSYLGKAYYEEKRTGLDEREWETAKALDPKDPTPWLYGAIAKQTTNRPVEALRDLERSIELNDGRAVYRSRLLLDSDLAARSASLARIYGDLGFEQLALVEGWKSVGADPTSDSAHRLLADSYAALPRHEVARVSELLQAQLLQPINIAPIQPRLAESNLFLVSRGGPGAQSFSEFNPLFDRDRLALQLSGVAGDRSTYGVEPVVSGIYRNLSFSVGYTGLKTDGFRENNGLKDQIATAFVQAELSSATSVQAEYRHRENEFGDMGPHFFLSEIRPLLRQREDRDTFRFGARHAFAPGSILLASAAYQKTRGRLADDASDIVPVFGAIEFKDDRHGGSGELQHLFRSRYVNLVSGAGYASINGKQSSVQYTILPPPDDQIVDASEQHIRHANAYVYATFPVSPALSLTAGLSGDALEDDVEGNRKQLNPKAGLTWMPFAGTTFRAAAFHVLRRTFIAEQTVEPTQVAGFNQFFDDMIGTSAWRYGVAIDQKFSRDVFGGVEASRRDLTVPVDRSDETDWKESLGRAYLFWAAHRWLALRAEYSFEYLERDPSTAALGVREVRTHRLPLGIAFFHDSGLGASATATYYSQAGKFGAKPFAEGSAHFWVVDAGLSWRLPRRYGSLGVTATNLLDQHFMLYENGVTTTNSTAHPARAVLARLTLNVP